MQQMIILSEITSTSDTDLQQLQPPTERQNVTTLRREEKYQENIETSPKEHTIYNTPFDAFTEDRSSPQFIDTTNYTNTS